MLQHKRSLSLKNSILLLLVAFNLLIVAATVFVSLWWSVALLVSAPLLVIAVRDVRQRGCWSVPITWACPCTKHLPLPDKPWSSIIFQNTSASLRRES